MNKDQAKERLCAIETEVEKLRRIIDEPDQRKPEPRKPEAGDVWQDRHNGASLIVLEEQKAFFTDLLTVCPYEGGGIQKNLTYLGKFDEVYVKASDVLEALSIKDDHGDSFASWMSGGCEPYREAIEATADTLRELNIIK
jgi:hypothetical protein